MPTYKETLEWSYKLYPRQNVDELDVLNQLFFVLGNGYRWVDGELVDKYSGSFEKQYEKVKAQRALHNEGIKKLDIILHDDLFESEDYKLEQNKQRAERTEYRLRDGRDPNGPSNIYPIYDLSEIMNLPDDIKPDWLEAAKKAIQYANEGKWILTGTDKSYILKAEQRIKEIEANQC